MDGGKQGESAYTGWTGRAMVRREDPRLLRGEGRFVDDHAPDGCLVLEFLRCPHGAGRIVALDLSRARAAPGVLAVFAAEDLPLAGRAAVNPLLPDAVTVPMQPLARDRVGAVGQAVAAVVATSRAAALDARDLIALDVEEGDPGEAPVAVTLRGHTANLPGGMRVRAEVRHALVAPAPLEPRAALAMWDGTRLVAWLSTQTPHRCRDDLCTMLGLGRDAVRVIAPDVGGAFGGKASLMPEDVVVCAAARALGRPVKWCATRSEEFLAATQGRGAVTGGEIAVDDAGRVLGLRATLDHPLGHWMPYSALAPARNAARILPGPYAVDAVDIVLSARITPGAAVNIYRGAGRPEAAMLMERLMDRAARRLGIDPVAMRRRNLVPAADLPRQTATGETLCSGNFPALLDRLEAESGYPGLRRAQAARRAEAAGTVTGLGLALYVEPCGQGWEWAGVTLRPDGRFRVATGSGAQGQGRETALAQIAADALGVAPWRVQVTAGDTDAVAAGIGALASRSTAIGGSAVHLAAGDLAAQIRAAAARLLNCRPDLVRPGIDGCEGPGDARLTWETLAARAGPPDRPVLSATRRYLAPGEAWASGAVLAEIAIDRETGVVRVTGITWVDDAGRVVNPRLVDGQLTGGMAQGLGAALLERIVYQDGQLVTGSLMDYALPRAADMPPLRTVSQPVPTPANALGVKGVGEAGCIGVPAAILNAVEDALHPFDAPELHPPLTPERVWRAMQGLDR